MLEEGVVFTLRRPRDITHAPKARVLVRVQKQKQKQREEGRGKGGGGIQVLPGRKVPSTEVSETGREEGPIIDVSEETCAFSHEHTGKTIDVVAAWKGGQAVWGGRITWENWFKGGKSWVQAWWWGPVKE